MNEAKQSYYDGSLSAVLLIGANFSKELIDKMLHWSK